MNLLASLPRPLLVAAVLTAGLSLAWSQTRTPSRPGSGSGSVTYQTVLAPAANEPLSSNSAADLVTPAAAPDYQVGASDLLYVYVYQMPEYTRQIRVDKDGSIRLDYLNQALPASGHTTAAISGEVATALSQAGLAHQPMVSVAVREVMSQLIVVAGAVRDPLTIQAPRPMTLMDLLARAGGLSADPPASAIAIISHNLPDPNASVRVDLAQLFSGTDPGPALEVYGGASVLVLQAQLVYAVGALEKPGAFPIRVGEPVTALKLISLAQGIRDPASKNKAEIIHRAAGGNYVQIPVNLDQVLQHKIPDPVLQAGDMLYIPENGRTRILASILADAGQAAVLAVGYH